jgi:hypothetical protein
MRSNLITSEHILSGALAGHAFCSNNKSTLYFVSLIEENRFSIGKPRPVEHFDLNRIILNARRNSKTQQP